MINKDTLIKVVNKYNGTVGYNVPDLGVHRNFYPNESKDITFDELEKLSFSPGGEAILKDFLEIQNKEAITKLFATEPEPEYHYTKDDIKKLMQTGTLDQFLDCLDFAPQSVKEIIKDMAVELPLNDVEKRNAIQEKLGFDVNKAIEIKNTKYDGGEEDTSGDFGRINKRRTAPIKSENVTAAPSGRRYNPIKSE